MELSAKTKAYFTTAIELWDAEFYVKVDDDVHVNLGKIEFSSFYLCWKEMHHYVLNKLCG